MAADAAERTGVLIVRVWTEGGPTCLRARVTQALDISRPERTSSVAASPEEIHAALQAWLEAFVALERNGAVDGR